jgi:hypothetical protein
MKFLLFLLALNSADHSADHTELILKMRDAALNYSNSLQDFVCTQNTVRSADTSGSGKHWKLLETQELDLGYISHKERYRLLKVNGKATDDPEKRIKKGYFRSSGEFGTVLRRIFDPKTAAEFVWDHEDSKSCIFRYQVPVATTTLEITADQDHVKLAHHGFVTADCETGMVTRIQMESEPAAVIRSGRNVAIGMNLDLRYGMVAIGDRQFLLPRDAVEIAPFGKTLTKVEISFTNYRKYDSDSHIKFDEPAYD